MGAGRGGVERRSGVISTSLKVLTVRGAWRVVSADIVPLCSF